MKIEMGESLMYAWLRHVKGCQVAQLNWKATVLESSITQQIEDFYQSLKEPYLLKSSLTQFLTQAEIDVLGIRVSGNTHELYAIDIAFHEGGLGYKNIIDKVAKKMIRSALTLYTQFNVKAGTVVFATPKVRGVVAGELNQKLAEISKAFNKAGFSYEFVFLHDESFKKEVLDAVVRKAKSVKDTSDLFVRSVKLLGMFEVAMAEYNFSEALDTAVDEVAEDEVLGNVDNPRLSEAELKALSYQELLDYYQENPQETKIGKVAQLFFDKLEREGKLAQFTTQSSTTTLGRYPLLLPVAAGAEKQTLRKGGTSQNRYYERVYQNNGQEYLLCSQWYPRHFSVLDAIVKDLNLN